MDFIERHAGWTAEQAAAAEEIRDRAGGGGLKVVRLVFADQHGLLRGKTVTASEVSAVLREGTGIASSLLAKDTSGRTVFPLFTREVPLGLPELRGAADMVMVPDPLTFRMLPWSPGTGWLLCDLRFTSGAPVPLCTRGLLRSVLAQADGLTYRTGLEVEFHLFRLDDPRLGAADLGQPGAAPEVGMLNHGYQYLSELRYDELDPMLDVLRGTLEELGLPLRTLEVEFGPSQVELTLRPADGLGTADAMVLLRSAVKQVAARHGHHATFMCRPHLPGVFSSGWHLHQSMVRGDVGVFAPETDARTGPDAGAGPVVGGPGLSPYGNAFLGGLLRHARATSALSTPTLNGFKRFRALSLAPDRAVWGRDNRGAMVRVLGDSPSSTRLENRIGEPAANPYLYLASQLAAGLDGVVRGLDPGRAADEPYATRAEPLPRSLGEALDALEADRELTERLGKDFVAYYTSVKRAEIARFDQEVTDWEQREYFRVF
ncbi:glutamine synthetase family protein [Streptomyces cylindrosporus]|uniref:Glutamine synthetase family protein n=1 Tax=Streptomyces cylindrosporus TaxID=2927583 RepID=A0ABS9YK02_9ACTN|nr:glutamine synthetase family protein [Streptomyces cylindrosporus]MCI3276910.1 glutamine synthetase family protein [Streptomyces cylindrosporus]